MLERKSYNEVGKIYFFTATIHQLNFTQQAWMILDLNDLYKEFDGE